MGNAEQIFIVGMIVVLGDQESSLELSFSFPRILFFPRHTWLCYTYV